MAVQIIGYPQETNYCPSCGSSNIESHDQWHDDGKVICNDCGCRCVVIQDDDAEGGNCRDE